MSRQRGTVSDAARESGSITPLVLGYVVLLVALVILVVDITAVQLARARLYDVADALALEAADAISQETLYRRGLGSSVPVTDETVAAAAQRLLAVSQRPANVSSWQLSEGTAASDSSGRQGALVVLTGTVDIPLGSGLVDALGGSVTVTARSHAHAAIRPAISARR